MHEPCWAGPVSHRVLTTHLLPGHFFVRDSTHLTDLVRLVGNCGRQTTASHSLVKLFSGSGPGTQLYFPYTLGWRRSVLATTIMLERAGRICEADRNFASDGSHRQRLPRLLHGRRMSVLALTSTCSRSPPPTQYPCFITQIAQASRRLSRQRSEARAAGGRVSVFNQNEYASHEAGAGAAV